MTNTFKGRRLTVLNTTTIPSGRNLKIYETDYEDCNRIPEKARRLYFD
jgi:hypothetical protein